MTDEAKERLRTLAAGLAGAASPAVLSGTFGASDVLARRPGSVAIGRRLAKELKSLLGVEGSVKVSPASAGSKWEPAYASYTINPKGRIGKQVIGGPAHPVRTWAHEMGHLKAIQRVPERLRFPAARAAMISRKAVFPVAALAGARAATDDEPSYLPAAAALAASAPVLADELAASGYAAKAMMRRSGFVKGLLKSVGLAPAFATYLAPAAAPFLISALRKRGANREASDALNKRARLEFPGHPVHNSTNADHSGGSAVAQRVVMPGLLRERVREGVRRTLRKQAGRKCKYCNGQATRGVIWADGRGVVPCCDAHLGRAKQSVSDIVAVRDLTKHPLGKRRPLRKQAGGSVKKQVTHDGIKLKLEHVPGDTRSGKSRDGKSWSRKMKAGYGYVAGTGGRGADGEAIDVYYAKSPTLGAKVYKVRQKRRDGGYDEDKYMVGYSDAAAARADFLRHMPSWAFGSMTTLTIPAFRRVVA